MNAVTIEHVLVSELPPSWQIKLKNMSNSLALDDVHVTVHIEKEQTSEVAYDPTGEDLLFGMWRDREDMADVEDYVRRLRAPRFKDDVSPNTSNAPRKN